ncbi:MAG: hypothetical protein EHM12_08150 [Dehalococcoidia bacterium]|nr:MAG: hypothetical protein EHM12_08150 [Dehalococcoidia bacterium]
MSIKTGFKIPKSFYIFNHKINVEICDKILDERDRVGEADFRQNKIRLVNKQKHNIPDSQQAQTFFHELLHHCFNQLNEEELNSNEKLIDNMAGVLAQAFETMEY